MSATHDVVIAGSGPAGGFAAALLARRGRSVALVDVADFPRGIPAAWVSPGVEHYLRAVEADPRDVLAGGVESVTFHNADFSKTIRCAFDKPFGQLVDSDALSRTLFEAAGTAGAATRAARTVAAVHAGEDAVELILDAGDAICGRVLIVADGGRQLAGRLGLGYPGGRETLWRAQSEVPLPGAKRKKNRDGHAGISIVLGNGSPRAFGYLLPRANSVVVGFCQSGGRDDLAIAYRTFWRAAGDAGLLPHSVTAPPDDVVWQRTSAGGALEMESHMAKRTLVVADAGGFVAAVSNETVYPGMWSAEIAVDVVDAALDAPNVQDRLAGFETRWRTTMAEYLRMPNTDVQLLWPLVFSNQQMADKMAAAFLLGENM